MPTLFSAHAHAHGASALESLAWDFASVRAPAHLMAPPRGQLRDVDLPSFYRCHDVWGVPNHSQALPLAVDAFQSVSFCELPSLWTGGAKQEAWRDVFGYVAKCSDSVICCDMKIPWSHSERFPKLLGRTWDRPVLAQHLISFLLLLFDTCVICGMSCRHTRLKLLNFKTLLGTLSLSSWTARSWSVLRCCYNCYNCYATLLRYAMMQLVMFEAMEVSISFSMGTRRSATLTVSGLRLKPSNDMQRDGRGPV